jgi:hypothetical protein
MRALRAGLLVAAALVALGVAWRLCIPGCFSIDEATLLLSARSLAQGHGIEVWNGFEETGSPALAPGWLQPVGGRLVSQYPDFFLFLSLPAFRALGLRGLMLVNLLAFAAVVGLTWRLAATRFGRSTAAAAVALLAGGSFAIEYAVGAWPHMTSALLVLAPLALVDAAVVHASPRRAASLAALAGAIGGFGIGVRLDVAFGLAGLAGALLLRRPARGLVVAALGAGAVPPLALLALLNHEKFGRATPFTYGASYGIATGAGRFLPLAGIALALVLVVAWLRGREGRSTRGRGGILLVAVAASLVGVLAFAPARRVVASAAAGVAELAVDLRLRGGDHPDAEPGRERGDPVRHFGALKKALLQSCPWLVVAGIPWVLAVRRREGADLLLLWGSVPGAYLLAYGAFAWDGGLALNQRYFVPALPALALLGARGLEQLRARAQLPARAVAGLAAVTTVALVAVSSLSAGDAAVETRMLLDLPLLLATILGVVLLLAGRAGSSLAVRRLALAAAAVAIGFSVFSCPLGDLPRTLERRARFAAAGERVRDELRGDALLLSEPTVTLASAIDATSRARLANPSHDFYRSFGALVAHHLAAGHQVFLSVPPARYPALVDAGLERLYRVREIPGTTVSLLELLAPEPSKPEEAR